MKKYLTEIGLYFLLPLVLIGGVSEYSLRKLPNDYAYKNQWLTQNSQEVEVLALGASSVLFDINPLYFNKRSFNAAHVSQSLKYDHMIFEKFIDNMPSLEYVIMSIDYWSVFGDLEGSAEWWRVKNYNIHYGSRYNKWNGKYNLEVYLHDVSAVKYAANAILTMVGIKNETRRTVDDRGYSAHYKLENRANEWDKGVYEASYHNNLISRVVIEDRIKQNKHYVKEIIEKCAEKNVKVLLINVPIYKSYRENLKLEYLNQQKEFCKYFVENFSNTLYYDFSDNPIFTEDDFYDVSHLNEFGAKKFTMILDSIMVNQ